MQAGSLYVASGIYGVVEAVPHFPDFTTEFTATPLETTSSRFEQIETWDGRGVALDTRHASVVYSMNTVVQDTHTCYVYGTHTSRTPESE